MQVEYALRVLSRVRRQANQNAKATVLPIGKAALVTEGTTPVSMLGLVGVRRAAAQSEG